MLEVASEVNSTPIRPDPGDPELSELVPKNALGAPCRSREKGTLVGKAHSDPL